MNVQEIENHPHTQRMKAAYEKMEATKLPEQVEVIHDRSTHAYVIFFDGFDGNAQEVVDLVHSTIGEFDEVRGIHMKDMDEDGEPICEGVYIEPTEG